MPYRTKIERSPIVAALLLLGGFLLLGRGVRAEEMSVRATPGDRPARDWLAFLGVAQTNGTGQLASPPSPRHEWEQTVQNQIPDILVFADGRVYWRDGALAPTEMLGDLQVYSLRDRSAPIYQGRLTPDALAGLRRRLHQSGFLTKPLLSPPPIPGGIYQFQMGVRLDGQIRSLSGMSDLPAKGPTGEALKAILSLHPVEKKRYVPDGILIGAERRSPMPYSATAQTHEAPEKSVPWPLKTPPPFALVMSTAPFLYPTFRCYSGEDARALHAVLAQTNVVSAKGETYHLFSLPAPPYYITP